MNYKFPVKKLISDNFRPIKPTENVTVQTGRDGGETVISVPPLLSLSGMALWR